MSRTDVKPFLSRYALYFVIGFSFLFVCTFYSDFLFHPSDYLWNDENDALKNYFCFEWHVHNDRDFINYTGSNYPFGENHGYTDGNPLLSNLLRSLPFLKSHSIAVFNLSLVLSFLACAILIYKILTEFRLHPLLMIISAIGITILCPQVFRIKGHFNLAYSFFLPLTIYYLVKYETRGKPLKHTMLISFFLLCFFFLHPYLGMIASAFVITFWLIKLIFLFKDTLPRLLHFFIQGIMPVALFFLFSTLTDNHSDRPQTPYGFLFFTASIESVFISTMPPFRHMLSQIYKIKEQNWEGLAYIGLASLIAIVCSMGYFYRNRTRLSDSLHVNTLHRTFAILSAASVILLIFSMGYPFKWNMEWLLDKLDFVKQFRAPGRFAWIFYFMTTLWATIFFGKYFLSKASGNIRLALAATLLATFTVEGIPFHKSYYNPYPPKNAFNIENTDPELKSVIAFIQSTQKAQAIIPLPFYHFGTDYYNLEGSPTIKKASSLIAFHTNIPLMANATPRTSLEESRKVITVFASDLNEKLLKPHINSSQPFLVLYSKEPLKDYEMQLLSKGETLLETKHYLLKKITPVRLFTTTVREKTDFYYANKDRLQQRQNFYVSDSSYFYFKENCPKTGNSESLRLGVIPSQSLVKEELYEVSFVFDINEEKDINYVLNVLQNSSNGTTVLANGNINAMPDIEKEKIIARLSFKTENTSDSIYIELSGREMPETKFSVKKLMIRSVSATVYEIGENSGKSERITSINNIPLR